MSEENVEIVRRAFDEVNAFMRGELSSEAFAELFDPQLEYDWREQTYPDTPQHLRGVPEVVAFAEQFRDGWVGLVQEPLEFHETPDGRVLALIRQRARGRESGVPLEVHFFQSQRSGMGDCGRSSSSVIAPRPSKPPGCRSSSTAALDEKRLFRRRRGSGQSGGALPPGRSPPMSGPACVGLSGQEVDFND